MTTFASEIKPKIYEGGEEPFCSLFIIWRPTNQGGYFCCKDMIGMWVCLMAKKKNVANRPSPSDDEQQNSTTGGNASTSFPRGSPEWKRVVSKVTTLWQNQDLTSAQSPSVSRCLPWSILGDKHVWEAACQRGDVVLEAKANVRSEECGALFPHRFLPHLQLSQIKLQLHEEQQRVMGLGAIKCCTLFVPYSGMSLVSRPQSCKPRRWR